MAVDPNTGEIIPKGKSPRFLLWLSFFAFATITLGSAVSLVSRSFASH
jgi:ABC-type multidrug transport system permease subunit